MVFLIPVDFRFKDNLDTEIADAYAVGVELDERRLAGVQDLALEVVYGCKKDTVRRILWPASKGPNNSNKPRHLRPVG